MCPTGVFRVYDVRLQSFLQILYLYGYNRKTTQPCLVTLSGMGSAMMQAVKRIQGFDTWVGVKTESRCYTELFDKGGTVNYR